MKTETNKSLDTVAHQITSELTIFRNREIDSQTSEWFRQNSSKNLAPLIAKLKINDLDLISVIANHPESRLSDLTQFTNVRQGTISKMVNKFGKLELVTKFHQNNNEKNTYLKLTPLGAELADLHAKYHQTNQQRMEEAMSDFTLADLELVQKFLSRINELDGKNSL